MKNRKWMALALAAAMVGSLTACGGGSGTADTTAAAAAADTTAAPAADTTAAADAQAPAGDGTGLVYWSMWESTEPQGQVIKEAVDKFSADTGVAVDVQFKGRTGIREGLQPALDAGTNIDLFDEDIDRVNTTWGAYLMDLEELAKASDYDATANASLMEACREVGGGTLKSIPYQPNVFAFFYNKAIFEEAGVAAVPTTWAELDAACQKIKDAGYTPITCDDAYILCLFGYHMSRLNGYDKTSDIVKNNKWDDPSVMETAKAYADFAQKGYFSENIASNVFPAGQNQELALGTAAMYLNGSWLPNEVKNYGGQVLAINKNSQHAEDAFKLITYITKGEFDKKLSEESLGIPSDTTNSEWPVQLTDVKPVMESLKTRYPWAAGAEDNVDMTPIIKENMTKLCSGAITADEFVSNLQAAGK